MHCGLSPEDLASEILNKYLLSPNALGWRKEKGSLATFLGAVLHNKLIDYLRCEKALLPADDDPDGVTHPASTAGELNERILATELTGKLLNLIKGHKHEQRLCDFIHASQKITVGGKANQQLAEIMRVDEGEVINCRKMLLRVAGVKELYEDVGHGRKRDQGSN
jgi:DNA-directed RNA polymerase specialized sigma24 family protein